jgi:hypothetical protein
VSSIGKQGQRMPDYAENNFEQDIGGVEHNADGKGGVEIGARMGVIVSHGLPL